MDLNKKKILVTGADGFIGSHLTEELVRRGCVVRAFVLYNSFNSWGWLDSLPREIKEQIEIFTGDIRDPHGIKKAMQGCDIVFHLAALISIPHSYNAPDAYVDTNVKGTLNVLQGARELAVEKLIHTSTSEVYGTAKFVPFTENHPLQGQSPYAATKIAADQLAMSFYYSFDLPVSIIRPFNTYGPRQSARAIIPTVITQIAGGKRRILVGSLNPTRDFVYVQDTVSGFLAAASSPESIGEAIHFSGNYEISIEQLLFLIAEIMEVSIQPEVELKRLRPPKSEVERLWADNTKAKSLLGLSPSYAGLEGLKRGLKNTIDWFSEPVNLQRYKAGIYNI